MKIFMSYVSAYQGMTSAEENFNTQVDRMNHSMTTVSLFPQPLLSLPNEFMNKVVIVTGIRVIRGLSNMDFHSSRTICVQLLLTICQQQVLTSSLK